MRKVTADIDTTMWQRDEYARVPPMEAIKLAKQCDEFRSMAAQPHEQWRSLGKLASSVDSNIRIFTEVGEPFVCASVAGSSIDCTALEATPSGTFSGPDAAVGEQQWCENAAGPGAFSDYSPSDDGVNLVKQERYRCAYETNNAERLCLASGYPTYSCDSGFYSGVQSGSYPSYPVARSSLRYSVSADGSDPGQYSAQANEGAYASEEAPNNSLDNFPVTPNSGTRCNWLETPVRSDRCYFAGTPILEMVNSSKTIPDCLVEQRETSRVSPTSVSSVPDGDQVVNDQEALFTSPSSIQGYNLNKYRLPNANMNAGLSGSAFPHGFNDDKVNTQPIKFRIRTITDCEFQCPSTPQPFPFLPPFPTTPDQPQVPLLFPQQRASVLEPERASSGFQQSPNLLGQGKPWPTGDGLTKCEESAANDMEINYPPQAHYDIAQETPGSAQKRWIFGPPSDDSSSSVTDQDVQQLASKAASLQSDNNAVMSEKLAYPAAELGDRVIENWMNGINSSAGDSSYPSCNAAKVDQLATVDGLATHAGARLALSQLDDVFSPNSHPDQNASCQHRQADCAPRPKFQSVSYIQGEFDGWNGQLRQPEPRRVKEEPAVWQSISLQTSPFPTPSIPATSNAPAMTLLPYQPPSWFTAEAYSRHSIRLRDDRQHMETDPPITMQNNWKTAVGKQSPRHKPRLSGTSSVPKKYRRALDGKNAEEKKFVCSYSDCSKRFSKDHELRVHVNKYHLGMKKPYFCNTCDKSFKRPDQLKRHQKIHTGEKPHECSICGRCFARTDHRNTHFNKHSGEKPFACSQRGCDRRFSRNDELRKHEATHRPPQTNSVPSALADVTRDRTKSTDRLETDAMRTITDFYSINSDRTARGNGLYATHCEVSQGIYPVAVQHSWPQQNLLQQRKTSL